MANAINFCRNGIGPISLFLLTLLGGFLAAGQIETNPTSNPPPTQSPTSNPTPTPQHQRGPAGPPIVTGRENENAPIEKNSRGFVTSEQCRQCHAHHHDTWHASHHRTMTQVPSEETVLADFDNKVLHREGRTFRFFHRDDDYYMELGTPSTGQANQQLRTFRIALMTGAHHQQGFWCETGKGRTLAKIPFIWINKERRWGPYGSIFFLPSTGLNMHAGIWNSNCIKCHVVGGQPRLDSNESKFDTHVAEFGISCEACHGPGDAHVAHHQGFEKATRDIDNDDGQSAALLGKVDLINPAELDHRRSSETCGQCHSVFDFYNENGKNKFLSEDGLAYRPGDNLLDSRHVFRYGHDQDLPIVKQKLARDPKFWEHQFWPDGMVRVSGREFNGLLETPCYQHGQMSCLSCHDMHQSLQDDRPHAIWANDQMKVTMRGNQACVQCHQEFQSEQSQAAHSHHAAGSSGSLCYNCHMPHTTLGLMKAMRSHTIDSPNVATTVSTGRPNACNLCHLDKTLDWTSQHLEAWYKIPPPKLSDQEKTIASSVRWILTGDAGQRGIVGWHFGWDQAAEASGKNWMAPFLAELLTDSYDVVRFIGYHALKEMPGFSNFEYDFVGSEQSRKLGRERALQRWNGSKDRPLPSQAIMIDSERNLIEQAIESLRKQRVDPPIKLVE